MQDITVRVADPERDAERLLEIYSPYVEKTAISFELEVPTLTEFRQRMEHTLCRYPYLVAEQNGRIVGYAYAGPFKEREAYDHAVETSIYLDSTCRHQGIGKRLYAALERSLSLMNVLNLNACIGVPEEGESLPFLDNNSCDFHAHLGYRLVGRFHQCGYKFGTWVDMVWMEKMIGDHRDTPAPFLPFPEVRDRLGIL
jgi:L-amino acid N-acyltransferase YncA